jgi:hypothetical protein
VFSPPQNVWQRASGNCAKSTSQDEPSLAAQGLAWQSHPQAALHITLLQDMAFGLQHIQHQRGMTHLDIKPVTISSAAAANSSSEILESP